MTLTPELLLALGPLLLFAMATAETAVPLGLLVPAGVALALGAFLAQEGLLEWGSVVGAAGAGALTGDSIGYWLGRRGGAPLTRLPGFLGRQVARYRGASSRLVSARPLVSVTFARTVSFVRTLMPATAGFSGISYPRFLLFEIPGVLAWLALYITVGVLAGESWKVASGLVGTGWAVLLVIGGVAAWIVARRRRGRDAADVLTEPLEPLPHEISDSLLASDPEP